MTPLFREIQTRRRKGRRETRRRAVKLRVISRLEFHQMLHRLRLSRKTYR